MTNPSRATTDINTGERVYTGLDPKRRYYGVTSVLGSLPKQMFLVPWAAKVVAEVAAEVAADYWYNKANSNTLDMYETIEEDGEYEFDIEAYANDLKHVWEWERDQAGEVGDEVHEAAEYILKESRGVANIAEALLDTRRGELGDGAFTRLSHLVSFLRSNQVRVENVEFTVYNDTEGYAGSCDLAAWVNGVPYILDIKTGKDVHEDVALQLTAYSRGEYILGDADKRLDMPFQGVELDTVHAAVLHLRPTFCKMVDMACDEEMFDCFKSLILVKRLWMDGGAKEAKGKVIYDSRKEKK